jgi:hypothetical protein
MNRSEIQRAIRTIRVVVCAAMAGWHEGRRWRHEKEAAKWQMRLDRAEDRRVFR